VNEPASPLVVIGVGNALLADDAIGVHVVEALRARAARSSDALPAGTRLVDGGTLGADLVGWVHGSRGLVLVDAVRRGGPAGSITILRGDDVAGSRAIDGTPAEAPGELVALARLMGWLPAEVSLVGIEAADIDLGVRLSAAVRAAIPAATDAVMAELDRIDIQTRHRSRGGDAARMAGALA
jgi:hydrogenase maturation protease